MFSDSKRLYSLIIVIIVQSRKLHVWKHCIKLYSLVGINAITEMKNSNTEAATTKGGLLNILILKNIWKNTVTDFLFVFLILSYWIFLVPSC